MITKDSLKALLIQLGFTNNGNHYRKTFTDTETYLGVDFDKALLVYPEEQGLKINERQTCNFSANENFVVFECVHRLLEKGYKPKHIELEPKWKLGHGASGGRADILIKDNQDQPLLIIECKTPGSEFNKAWKKTELNGDQLFSYAQQIPDTQFLCLYTSDFEEKEAKLTYLAHIISHKDNPKILAEDKNLKAFKDGGDYLARYAVWRDTYKTEYTTQGIFETNIQPYHIGKDKYTLDDLHPIDAKDKEGKYHRFRTILRKHNVSGRENAFDVLVNLFLCKIVDEAENTQDLKFYWKGIAYDSFFDLIDRLQALYKNGMERYLDQDIVYISNDQIENAFWAVKQKRNATKAQIKAYFRQLKFFTNNDFGFIDVHNEALFYKNAKVLLEVVQMWQDLRLKDREQNQFLGDMFEYFLDQGIKQSEGQFFTPMPICRFILMSLPLEQLIKDCSQPPKAIDYACGAGHFLNELAAQLSPFINQYKQTDPKAFFQEIIGVEKEYRLSKVAKVAAFMYGQEGINILHHDALDQHAKLQKHSFNILVANPPFAVEGFLETLPEDQREQYALTQTVGDVANNKNIQCFFLERAKQLLAPGGVAGIIVPSSVLSNSDATHVGSREILLQYFDIIALVELGSGTFGKTGTNTVVLFIRRKAQQPEPCEHYRNRVEDWFDNDEDGAVYQDLNLLKAYCAHLGLAFEHYQSLLQGQPNAQLLAHEVFKDYHAHFAKATDITKLKTQKFFKAYSAEQQQAELDKRFLVYLHSIEKDKLFYFVLAYSNPQNVLVVKSPSDTKEQKAFLGYEWSAAKGNEGIKLVTDKDGNHVTPLYHPQDRNCQGKINSLITQNFLGQPLNLSGLEDLTGFVSAVRLVDLLDFSRVGFEKQIALNITKNVEIQSQWPLFKLSDLVEIISGGTPDTGNGEYWDGDIPWLSVADFSKVNRFVESAEKTITEQGLKNSSTKILQISDIIVSARGTVGAIAQLKKPMAFNQSCYGLRAKNKTSNDYIFYVFSREIEQLKARAFGSKFDAITIKTFDEVKIPLPPLEIQQKIVIDCETIDNAVTAAQEKIVIAKNGIELVVNHISAPMRKLSEITSKIGSGATPKGGEAAYKETGITLIRSQNIYDDIFKEKGLAYIDEEQAKLLENVTVEANDILFNITGASVARCNVANPKYLPARVNQHVAIIRPTEAILPKYLHNILISSKIKSDLLRIASSSSTREAITKTQLEEFKIPVPTLADQQTLVAEIEQLEQTITAAQTTITAAAAKKQAVLDKYL